MAAFLLNRKISSEAMSCPFCGEVECVYAVQYYDEDEDGNYNILSKPAFCVVCDRCSANGPIKDRFEDAIMAWNNPDILSRRAYSNPRAFEDYWKSNPPYYGQYREIIRLRDMLLSASIPYHMYNLHDGYTIVSCRVVTNEYFGSLGGYHDRLELCGHILTEEERKHGSFVGDLTAEEVFGRIKKFWEEYLIGK